MISIIICSVNNDFIQKIKINIEATIGVIYELLIHDNREENRPICAVYNLLASRATYPNLLFLHEDVSFLTLNWGRIVADQLNQDDTIGVLGVAGSAYKSSIYSGWYSGIRGMDHFNIIHDNNGKRKIIKDQDVLAGPIAEACVLDGVFLACRKEVWSEIKFNETLLKGFHFYDIDFSLRASLKYKNKVLRNIDMIHYTVGGDFGEKWIKEAILFHQYYHDILINRQYRMNGSEDLIVFKSWLELLKNENIKFITRLKWVFAQWSYIRFSNLYNVFQFVLYRSIKLYKLHQFLIKK